MSTIYLNFKHYKYIGGVKTLTDVTSVVANDPTSTYGVKRTDTDAIVVAAGTPLVWQSTGTYQYSFTGDYQGVPFTWYPEWVYDGDTQRVERNFVGDSEEPVTVEEAKLWAHIDSDADDANISCMITAARQWTEEYTGHVLVNTSKTLKLDRFYDRIELDGTPLSSVTSITYLDADGTEQTLSTDIYDVDTTTKPGLVTLAYDESWPTTQTTHNAVTINYVSGYGSASDVPCKFKSAIMMLVANMDIHREATTCIRPHEVPFGVRALLGIDRIIPV